MTPSRHRLLDLHVPTRKAARAELERHAVRGEAPLLLMSLVQITGDTSHLDRFGPKIAFETVSDTRLLPPGRLPEAEQTELIGLLADALESADQPEYLQVPDNALFQRMLGLVTGDQIDDEFVPVVLEQGGFVPIEPVIDRITEPSPDFTVAILGAGMTGIAASIMLADAGFRHEIFEAGDDIGGTWRTNIYPGVAVDTPSIYYSFSFEIESQWSKYFPVGAEYQEYLRRVVDKYDVKRNIRFNTRIESLEWDDAAQEWIIRAVADGTSTTSRANAVITAAGFLNRPSVPNIPGIDTFAGTSIHTAEWNPDLDLKGKRVAIVGAGATSIQVVDAIIDDVQHLTLFQRQPHWVRPNVIGEGLVDESERWLQRNVPFYDRWQRARTYWFVSDRNYAAVRADAEWMKDNPLSISAANDVALQSCLSHLKDSFGHDPELLAAMTPDFPPHGKRMIRDPGGYYAALAGDKADVVTASLAEIVPQGVRTSDGEIVELDVIIWATGYTLDFLSTLEVTGRNGIRLTDQWTNNDPRSYLGGTVPNFPNLFVTSGPNSSAGHGGGHNYMTEVVVHYIVECLQLLTEQHAKSLEPTQEAQDEFLAQVDQEMQGSVWMNSDRAHTYYRNEAGRVILPNPWRMVDFWHMLRTPDPAKFVVR